MKNEHTALIHKERTTAAAISDAIRKDHLSKRLLIVSGILSLVLIGIPLLCIAIIYRMHVVRKETVSLPETADSAIIQARAEAWDILAGCQRLWRITASAAVTNAKTHAGAARLLDTHVMHRDGKLPLCLHTERVIQAWHDETGTLLVLPECILDIRGKTVSVLFYQDLNLQVTLSRFREESDVPADAVIIEKTWRYVNKDGSADRRYKGNYQIPICRYGKIVLRTPSGTQLTLMASSDERAMQFVQRLKETIMS